jgi:uncharacterized protein YyaL (SSP411 family)
MPSWTAILQAITEAWRERRDEIRAGSPRIRERLGASALIAPSSQPITDAELRDAVARLRESFDASGGGFGGAPKFPHASVIDFLLLRREREMSLASLRAMAAGGIHDQLGGGFARYSVDARWAVPHFEKMLYDNALLARAYLHGWQESGERALLDVCLDVLRWALREMRGPEGGFYSALDADSEGAEGRFYTWTLAQLRDALGADSDTAIAWFSASESGNFTDPHDPRPGLNVLQGDGPRPPAAEAQSIRARLLAVRAQRERPGLDDKRLTSWNALMIAALADAGTVLAREAPDGVDDSTASELLDAARACAEFLLGQMRAPDGRLLRVYNDGEAKIDAYLEDYAYMLEALIALFEADCDERWLERARAFADEIIENFADPQRGGFFSTDVRAQELIVRRKELEDNPIPSGSSSAARGLIRLAQITGESSYEHHAVSALRLAHEIAARHPTGFGALLCAMHLYLAPAAPIACQLPAPSSPAATHGESA